MSAEQMRRKGIENAEQKRKQEQEYQAKIDNMSKHNVGGLYDVRAIAKSRQFKEQNSFYNLQNSLDEMEDMFQSNRLYKFKETTEAFIKKITGRDLDSFTVRETGKFISELIKEIKLKYEVKE
jgi:hypothetical protein|tara:strand:+ start:149 stop:517 length:369 start_codon:yes stop_codon:yes gene_type:complete